MPLRTALLILFGILGYITFSFGAAVPILGENTSFTWRLGGAVQYNDNIFLDYIDSDSDTIIVFSPGVELNIGSQPSNANLNIVYIQDFVTYTDNSRLNRDTPDFKLTGFLKSAKSSISYGVSYKENTQNDASNNLAGDLAHRNVLKANVNGEFLRNLPQLQPIKCRMFNMTTSSFMIERITVSRLITTGPFLPSWT